jgi:hypothetical protein
MRQRTEQGDRTMFIVQEINAQTGNVIREVCVDAARTFDAIDAVFTDADYDFSALNGNVFRRDTGSAAIPGGFHGTFSSSLR